MKNPFTAIRPKSIRLYLNNLANSRQKDINQSGEAIGILEERIETLERQLKKPDWVVEGSLWVGRNLDISQGAVLYHSTKVFMDELGCFWSRVHEGTVLPDVTSWGMEHQGYLFFHTTYLHFLRWTGAVWEWAPGELGGGFFCGFAIDPGLGWKECDGTSTTYLKGDGTTRTLTLPDSVSAAKALLFSSAYSNSLGNYFAGVTASIPAAQLRLFFRI
jgi:hypothetical protein